jgi:hypothetical protein
VFTDAGDAEGRGALAVTPWVPQVRFGGPAGEQSLHDRFPDCDVLRIARSEPSEEPLVVTVVLPHATCLHLRICDVAGGLVCTLAHGWMEAGPHRLRWDGRNDRGEPVESGLYLCRMETPSFSESRKLLLLG